MGETKLTSTERSGSRKDNGGIAHQVSRLMQMQMERLMESPPQDWSPEELHDYQERRDSIRSLRLKLANSKAEKPQ